MVYGIGTDGLPSHVDEARRAQAKQLKAYLLVYEQLLGNAFAQIAHTGDLFSLDPETDRTYFVKEFSEALIKGYTEITNGLDKTSLESMTETLNEFHERRNRFLDHLMARFGEQFSEYALLLTNLQGSSVAAAHLIEDKTVFLKAYPEISHDRGKAFDYTHNICDSENISGLKKRISLLLGYPDLSFKWTLTNQGGTIYQSVYELSDSFEKIILTGEFPVDAPDSIFAEYIAGKTILKQMMKPEAWVIQASGDGFVLSLNDKDGNPMGTFPDLIVSKTGAAAWIDEFTGWSSNERAIVAEHLLLRPKFPGDALFPACSDGPCATCGDEDPYSFRLTLVMPGWSGPFSINMDMRQVCRPDNQTGNSVTSARKNLLGRERWLY